MTERNCGAHGRNAPAPPLDKGLDLHEEAQRLEYIGRLKAQIRSGLYQPDIRDLARSLATMMVHSL
jgi:hypothetical protein